MKTNLLTIAAIAASITLTSCLDDEPKGSLEVDSAYQDATTLAIGTVGEIYNYIGGSDHSQGLQGTDRGVYDLNTFTTDEAMLPTRGGDWYDGGLWQSLYNHTWTAGEGILGDTWNYLYKVVILCNQHLAILDAHADKLDAPTLAGYKAEIRGVRAMFYFYLMDLFGRIPLIEGTSTELSTVSQSKRSEVFAYIVGELQEVLPQLSESHSSMEGNYYGRMTQSVAQFLLAKLMLNAEVYTNDNWTSGTHPDGKTLSFATPEGPKNAWETCIYYCEQLKAEGFKLEQDYTYNFSRHNEMSHENIFTIPMDKMLYKNQFQYLFRSRHYKHGAALGMDAWNGTSATLSTMQAFGYGTDKPDTRMEMCFYYGPLYINGTAVTLEDGSVLDYRPLDIALDLTGSKYEKTAGARMKKYETDQTAYADGKLQSNDIVLFRFADVLLMEAEAKERNGQDGSEELNEVRQRVDMPAVNLASLATHLSAITSQNPEITPQLSAILRERLLELVWEGWRRNDLVRFGLFHKAYDQRTPTATEQDAHTTVFPIPGGMIDHLSNFTQNPGY